MSACILYPQTGTIRHQLMFYSLTLETRLVSFITNVVIKTDRVDRDCSLLKEKEYYSVFTVALFVGGEISVIFFILQK